MAAGAPAAELPRSAVVGALLADVLAAVGLQPSKAAARRLIKACNPRHGSLNVMVWRGRLQPSKATARRPSKTHHRDLVP